MPGQVSQQFDALWENSEKTDERAVHQSESNLKSLLRHFTRTNFRSDMPEWKSGYRAQCWECLRIFCARKPSGGYPNLNPPCHPISCCKDRERSDLGRFIVRGAIFILTSTLSSLFSVMGDEEQMTVLTLMRTHDIFVVRMVGTSRAYRGRTKSKYDVCEITDIRVFIVRTAARSR